MQRTIGRLTQVLRASSIVTTGRKKYFDVAGIAQPEAELNFYSKDDLSRQIGSGLPDLIPVCVCATSSAANSLCT